MRATIALQITLLSFVAALMGRFAAISFQEARENRMTDELCEMVGNYLEIGSLREAFEGLQLGLVRNQIPRACVSVIDNGRSFSPDCIDPKTNYRMVLCKAEANKGVRAQISYPARTLFNLDLFIWWLVLVALGSFSFLGIASVIRQLTTKISAEIEWRLKLKDIDHDASGLRSNIIGALLEKSGLWRVVHREVTALEAKLREFEARAKHETSLRVRKELEAERSNDYIEKVRQIRHDIRSPLSALFAARSAIANDDAVKRTLTSSIRGIENMVEALHQLEEADAQPRLTIAEVILEEEVGLLRQNFLTGKQASLFLEYSVEALSPVMVVPETFRRVVTNLLENAFDAVSFGGEIRIRVSTRGGTCRIAIEDNGCGIAAENIPNLFYKGATFGKVGGTGLGLYSARESVRRWKGDLSFEPLVQGSRFIVTMPCAQVGVTFVGLPDEPSIWVIDDKPQVAEQLSLAGFDVERSACDSVGGLKLLIEAQRVNATVLLDQNLGDGALGTDLLAEVPDCGNVYLCTDAFDDPHTLSRARLRSVRILPKPLCFLAAMGTPANLDGPTPAKSV